MTVCSAQITLTDNEFKFYAEKVIENEQFKNDIRLLSEEKEINMLYNDSIKKENESKINLLEYAICKDTVIRNNYKQSFQTCVEQKHKLEQKNKRKFKTIIVFATIIATETIVIYFTTINKIKNN